MATTRRDLLKKFAIGTCGSYLHSPTLNGIKGWANKLTSTTGIKDDHILIVIELAGGVSPTFMPAPSLQAYWQSTWPDSTIELNAKQHAHGQLPILKTLYDVGDLLVLNMVDFEGPHGSHPNSTSVWHSGIVGQRADNVGWMTKAACHIGSEYATVSLIRKVGAVDGYCSTVGLSGYEPATLDSIASIGEASQIKINSTKQSIDSSKYTQFSKQLIDLGSVGSRIRAGGSPSSGSDSLDYVYKEAYALEEFMIKLSNDRVPASPESSTYDLAGLRAEIASRIDPNSSIAGNGKELLRDTLDLVRLLRMAKEDTSFKPRILMFGCGGFDTHGNERPVLNDLLSQLNLTIEYIYKSCLELGIWDKVVLVTASEFSRTSSSQIDQLDKTLPLDNGVGTEHGFSGAMLVMGGKVNGGKDGYNSPPPETSDFTSPYGSTLLYIKNVRTDFRQVYWDILNQHIGFDNEILNGKIFPQSFKYDTSFKLFI